MASVAADSTPQLGGDLDVDGNAIVSTSNAAIDITPHGTGDVQLNADTIRIGDSNADVDIVPNFSKTTKIQMQSDGDLLINADSSSGDIYINAQDLISIQGQRLRLGVNNAGMTITTLGTGDLTLDTNSGTNSGSIVIADGVDQNISINPNGEGNITTSGSILTENGTNSLPSHSFTADTDTGMFRYTDFGNAVLSFAVGGSRRLNLRHDGTIQFNDAFTFPAADGSANQLLKTDGSGTLTWTADTNTTYVSMGSGNSYVAGLTPAGNATHGGYFLRRDGTWVVPPDTDTNTTYSSMGSGNSYAAGLTPSGSATHNDTFLRKDGTWVTPADTNTTYSAGNGLALSSTTFSIVDPINLSQLTESSDATDDKILLWDESASSWKYMTLDDLQDSIDTASSLTGAVTTIGTGSANAKLTSSGSHDLVLTTNTNAGFTEPYMQFNDGVGGHIYIVPGDDANSKVSLGRDSTSKVDINGQYYLPQAVTGTTGYVLTANTNGTTSWAAQTDTTYSVGDGGLTQNNFTNTLKSKLDAIEASADVTDKTNVASALASLTGDDTTYIGDAGNDTTLRVRGNFYVDGTTTTVNQTQVNVQNAFVFEGATANAYETTLTITDPTADRTITLPDATGTISLSDTQLSTEAVQDIVGAMTTGNTESGITVAYQDGDGTLDFTIGTLNQNTTGTAAGLTTSRTLASHGDVVWNSGAFNGTGNITGQAVIQAGAVDIAMLSATGTASGSTYLRGDNTWAAVSGGSNYYLTGLSVSSGTLTGTVSGATNPTVDLSGLYTAGTNLTRSGTTLNVDDAFLKNNANDTTTGTITAGGFTTTGNYVVGGHSFNDIDIGTEFVDSDNHLMSSGAIKEKIEGYGYGDVTLTGTQTLTNKTLTAPTINGWKATVVAVAGNTVLTQAQSGSYVYWTAGTCTLPTSATIGTQFTIFNNTGSSATVALGTNNAIVSGWAGNAAVADHEGTSYICVAATKWIQVG